VSETSKSAVAVSDALATTSRSDAFRRLTDRHLDASYRLARVILRDRADAEDAVHDACLAAWQKWSTLRDHDLFERWFQRILVNTCRNRLRRANRTGVVDVSPALVVLGVDSFAATDQRADLDAALAQLPPDDRVILALRYYRDLTVDDIGEVLGIPSGTVKSRLHSALKRFHDVMTDGDATEALR
jgi:RNA polymerase sigma-70 factor (ECF subfamily)